MCTAPANLSKRDRDARAQEPKYCSTKMVEIKGNRTNRVLGGFTSAEPITPPYLDPHVTLTSHTPACVRW